MTLPKDPIKREEAIQKYRDAALQRFADPENRKRFAEQQKHILSLQSTREKMAKSAKARWDSPIERERRSEISKSIMSRKEIRDKISKSVTEAWKDPILKQKLCDAAKRKSNRPEYIAKFTEWARTRAKDKKVLKEMSERTKKQMQNEMIKGKLIESIVGGFWYGNVRYWGDELYCEKWTPELRERVRAMFGYICVECKIPQTKITALLSVHHVYYNKKMCCDTTPRALVPLCKVCHSKTQSNKKYWSNHFQEIIDNQYGGRCWLTKEEYAALQNGG